MIGRIVFSGKLNNELKPIPVTNGKGSKVYVHLRCLNDNGEWERVIASAYIPEQVAFEKTPYAYPKVNDSVTIECSVKMIEKAAIEVNPDTGKAEVKVNPNTSEPFTNPVAYFNIERITLNNTKGESEARAKARAEREDNIVEEIEAALAEMGDDDSLPDNIPDPIPN